MELMIHWMTNEEPGGSSETKRTALQAGISAPYLLYQNLALSAAQFSILRPNQRDFYRNESLGFQSHAIALFNEFQPGMTPDQCIPIFLFSSSLGIHILFTTTATTTYETVEQQGFLDRFIRQLNMHHTVRAKISQYWGILRHHEGLQSILGFLDRTPEPGLDSIETRRSLDILIPLLESADLNQASKAACQAAMNYLNWVFAEHDTISDFRRTQFNEEIIFAWLLLIPEDFVMLLMRRSPEALVILAYSAVILHEKKNIWFVSNSGRMLIESISAYLGDYWDPWLSWPKNVLLGT